MLFKKLNSNKTVNINLGKYRVDWNKVVSKPQKTVKDFLKPYWFADYVLEEFRIPGSLLRFDLVNINKRVIVEVSPNSSHKYNKFFHKDPFYYKEAIKRGLAKYKWAEENNFIIAEIYDEDLENLCRSWFKDRYNIDL